MYNVNDGDLCYLWLCILFLLIEIAK